MNILEERIDELLAHPLSEGPTVAELRRRASRRRRRAVAAVLSCALAVSIAIGWARVGGEPRDASVVSGPGETVQHSEGVTFGDFEAGLDQSGRLTRPLNIDVAGPLQLAPPPQDAHPAVDASGALATIGQWHQQPGSPRPAVGLANVTTAGWGTPRSDGSLEPVVDDQLTWVIWVTGADVTSLYRGPGPAPSDPLIGNVIVLVDAQTGQVLDTIEGP